ncbi:hypothetical protein WT60_23450 [Burkholderia sp. MSMB617WGS]|nr:hypothetical protein WT60_23450 [Burkholderia sp. MSMB617WGS]
MMQERRRIALHRTRSGDATARCSPNERRSNENDPANSRFAAQAHAGRLAGARSVSTARCNAMNVRGGSAEVPPMAGSFEAGPLRDAQMNASAPTHRREAKAAHARSGARSKRRTLEAAHARSGARRRHSPNGGRSPRVRPFSSQR